eukprot:sb/3461217/
MSRFQQLVAPGHQRQILEPTDTSKQPISTRYLGHVTSYRPIRDQYFLIRSVPALSLSLSFHSSSLSLSKSSSAPSSPSFSSSSIDTGERGEQSSSLVLLSSGSFSPSTDALIPDSISSSLCTISLSLTALSSPHFITSSWIEHNSSPTLPLASSRARVWPFSPSATCVSNLSKWDFTSSRLPAMSLMILECSNPPTYSSEALLSFRDRLSIVDPRADKFTPISDFPPSTLTIYDSKGSAIDYHNEFRDGIPKEFYYKDGPKGNIGVIKVTSGETQFGALSDGILKEQCNTITSPKNPTTIEIEVQQSQIIGYISKIHFHYEDCRNKEDYPKPNGNKITDCAGKSLEVDKLDDDTWLFSPPIMTKTICITLTKNLDNLNCLTEVLVFKPVTYGHNAVIDLDRNDNDYDAAKEFCQERNLFLPSYKTHDGDLKSNYVGLEKSSENLYVQNDGTYNHYLTKTCTALDSIDCVTLCTVSDVLFLLLHRGGRHLLFCPHLPTFAHMGKLKSQKTGILWAKWAKSGQKYYKHQNFTRKPSVTIVFHLQCLPRGPLYRFQPIINVLTYDLGLIRLHVRLDKIEYYTVPFNSDLKGACADEGYGIPVTPSSELERWKIGQLYPGEIFRVSACNKSAQMEPPFFLEAQEITLSLSRRWYKIPQQLILTPAMTLASSDTVTFTNKQLLTNFDIEFVKNQPKLKLSASSTILRDRQSVTLFCTAENEPYRKLCWGKGDEINSGITEKWTIGGWQSAIIVDEDGTYTCQIDTDTKTKRVITVSWALTCDTDQLSSEVIGNGTITTNHEVLRGEKVEISCSEGFTPREEVRCDERGVFSFDRTPGITICTSTIAETFKEIEKLLDSNATVTEKSLTLRDTIRTGTFTCLKEANSSITFMKKLAGDKACLSTPGSMMHLVESVSTVLENITRLTSDMGEAMHVVQGCMEVVDMIGRDSKEPIKLADNGVALSVVDVNSSEVTSEITFAAHNISNGWNLDDLVLYDYEVNLTTTERMVFPKDFVCGRIWFTVYNNSLVNPNQNTASNVIGASIKSGTPALFKASIFLNKKYYGERATCAYWNTTTLAWSQDGVTKAKKGAVTIWAFGGLFTHARCQKTMSRPNTNPNPSPNPNPTRALALNNLFQHRRKHPDFNVFRKKMEMQTIKFSEIETPRSTNATMGEEVPKKRNRNLLKQFYGIKKEENVDKTTDINSDQFNTDIYMKEPTQVNNQSELVM